jgi:hypothetical protein
MPGQPAQALPQAPRAAALPPTFDAAAVAAALPGVDVEYVRLLVYTTVTNTEAPGAPRPLQRWPADMPMHHCLAAGVPQDAIDAAAAIVGELTGIRRAESGPCSIEWLIDPSMYGSGYAETLSPGHVRLVFHNEGSLRYGALHELGHVVGLGHSPRRGDLMYYLGGPGELAMSSDERAVLALMYAAR